MKINPGIFNSQNVQQRQNKKAEQEVKLDIGSSKDVDYVVSEIEEKKINYEKPVSGKVDNDIIAKLKQASEERYASLKRMVEELLSKQGMTFKDIDNGIDLKVDETTRAKAQEAISESGEYGAEAVSDRIVEFAKAISGGDKSKFDLIVGSIDQGFAEAKEILGGQLPEISKKTYELVMEKLELWRNEQ